MSECFAMPILLQTCLFSYCVETHHSRITDCVCFCFRYAQSSKRVNVKKLKTDLWCELQQDCSSEGNENIRTDMSGSNKELSFQDVVCDIAQGQTQKDASFSFYFICLLHLANEKVRSSNIGGAGTVESHYFTCRLTRPHFSISHLYSYSVRTSASRTRPRWTTSEFQEEPIINAFGFEGLLQSVTNYCVGMRHRSASAPQCCPLWVMMTCHV